MPESVSSDESSLLSQVPNTRKRLWSLVLSTIIIMVPVLAALLVYQLDSFDPAPLPLHELGETRTPMIVSLHNDHMLQGAEFVGEGNLPGPEDMAYDPNSQLLYTSCEDGWIKRVRLNLNDSTTDPAAAVENLVNTHGRPLGLVLGHNHELIVADAYKVSHLINFQQYSKPD